MAFGRLERSKAQEPISQINMTPLVDVMLVLVVIFIITAPLMSTGMKVDLPRSGATPASASPQAIHLTIDENQSIHLGKQPVTPEQLFEQLARAAQTAPQTEVQLRADKSVSYERIVQVMGLAHKAGLTRIGFVTQPERLTAPR
jgi:biopolymer transport protein TolR